MDVPALIKKTKKTAEDRIEVRTSSMVHDADPAVLSRRAVLKAGTVAMPVVLTLQSGAAMARSSNLISASPPYTTDRRGRTLCLDTNSTHRASRRRQLYDLGDPAYARVNVIRDRDHFVKVDEVLGPDYEQYGIADEYDGDTGEHPGMLPISEGKMCIKGGTFYSANDHGGWQQMHLPRNGIVVSATALSSFATGINAKYM